jgi:hypothetical protein
MRILILHHHIFKNAGSSIDYLLQKEFSYQWASYEGQYPWSILDNDSVTSFIFANPCLKAISSHQARPFFNDPQGLKIYPIIFLRNPLDRARSCYEYELKVNSTYPSSVAAQKGARYYIDFCLDENNQYRMNAFHNYQTLYLSSALNGANDSRIIRANSRHLFEAISYIDNLSFIGLVESFYHSLVYLNKIVKNDFGNLNFFNIKINSSPNRDFDLSVRIKNFSSEIGGAVFSKLEDANELDITLYEYASQKFTRFFV